MIRVLFMVDSEVIAGGKAHALFFKEGVATRRQIEDEFHKLLTTLEAKRHGNRKQENRPGRHGKV